MHLASDTCKLSRCTGAPQHWFVWGKKCFGLGWTVLCGLLDRFRAPICASGLLDLYLRRGSKCHNRLTGFEVIWDLESDPTVSDLGSELGVERLPIDEFLALPGDHFSCKPAVWGRPISLYLVDTWIRKWTRHGTGRS